MAKITSRSHQDERWGGHIDIGKPGTVLISVKPKMELYTIELWLRLKKYPLLREIDGSIINIPSKLLVLGDTQLSYDETHIHFASYHNGKSSAPKISSSGKIPYNTETWFQLVIANGQVGQLGYDTGDVYINGRATSESILFPPELHHIKIGIDVKSTDILRISKTYPSESSLGIVRIYSKILDKHEIYNNFLSGGRRYGILMETEAAPISNELYMELVPLKEHIKHNYWYSTEQIRKHELKNIKNIPINNYKMDNDLKELEAILKGLNQPPYQTPPAQDASQAQAQKAHAAVEGNIIILSRNPEMFLRNLQSPPDKITSQLIRKTQGNATISDYASIFDNPFKIKLLVTYLRSTPKHFLALLQSNVLTNEQLVILNSALQNNDTVLSGGARPQRGGAFVNPIGELVIPDSGHYGDALELLQNKLQGVVPVYREAPSTGKYTPYLSNLAQSTTQIAEIMNYNHKRQVRQERQAKEEQYMDTIQYLNDKISNTEQRTAQLEELLEKQNTLMGLIVSKKSGKCIGAIDKKGGIEHCSHKEAQSPYNIIVNKDVYKVNIANIMEQQKLSGASVDNIITEVAKKANMRVLGQCVNTGGKVVGLIVRQGRSNHYIPTKTGAPVQDVPILAILTPTTGTPDSTDTPGMNKEEACPQGKCKPGYVAQDIGSVTSEEWLHKSTLDRASEHTAERPAHKIHAYTEDDTKSINSNSSEEGAPKGLMSTKNGSNLPKHGEEAHLVLFPAGADAEAHGEEQGSRSMLSRVKAML